MLGETPASLERWNNGEFTSTSLEKQEISVRTALEKKGVTLGRVKDRPGYYLSQKNGQMTHRQAITLRDMMLFWSIDFHGETLQEEERKQYENAKTVAKKLGFTIEATRSGYRLLMNPIYGGFTPYNSPKPLGEVSAELERKFLLVQEAQAIVQKMSGYHLYQDGKNPDKYSLCIPADDDYKCEGTISEVLDYLKNLKTQR